MNDVRHIMFVEDDENLGFLVKDALEANDWKVSLYKDGEKGLTAFYQQRFDLCILDVMLPCKDGFDLATEIRKYNVAVPIIFLTAKNQADDRIRGFQVGADDYICKPFNMEELKYRIEAIAKRSLGTRSAHVSNTLLTVGNSTLDLSNLTVNSNGVPTQLTYKECKLLRIFFRHPNKLIEREVFLKAVWEDDGFFVARSMDVFISRLRKYLMPDSGLRIENIRSIGYILKSLV